MDSFDYSMSEFNGACSAGKLGSDDFTLDISATPNQDKSFSPPDSKPLGNIEDIILAGLECNSEHAIEIFDAFVADE